MAGSTTARQACNVQACTAQPAPAAPLPGSGEALPPRLCCSHTGCHERCREHCRDAHCPTTSMPAAALGTCVVGPAAAVLLAAPLPRLEEWPLLSRPHLSNHHGLLGGLGSGGNRQGSSRQRGHGGSLRGGAGADGAGVSAAAAGEGPSGLAPRALWPGMLLGRGARVPGPAAGPRAW